MKTPTWRSVPLKREPFFLPLLDLPWRRASRPLLGVILDGGQGRPPHNESELSSDEHPTEDTDLEVGATKRVERASAATGRSVPLKESNEHPQRPGGRCH